MKKQTKETCCVCGEPTELKCHACENYYCEKHYTTTVLTGNCCSENEKIYDSEY